ncbi:metallophosphoesterase [Candidatus Soleaferrea massiliensis]|uniref:metallophosphoesterase n=1 Tax=Candidatus Soleaferrea massiliensis TaxID=1470354 RepID=UPI00058CB7FE|nr:metallophosphoesterase [Candidatus Soleaferrea massiliensis]
MALFAIGDLHLSLGSDKPMDIFSGWDNYVDRLQENWLKEVGAEDTVVLAGDSSWGMSLQESLTDFRFIDKLPGKKIVMKGNHDYWWSTKSKMDGFFEENGLETIQILHNNSFKVGNAVVCGTRGWLFEAGEPHDQKILNREAGRLDMSIRHAMQYGGEIIAFLHYPPVYGNQLSAKIVDVLVKHNIQRCYYGHLHGQSCDYALRGQFAGIQFELISGDFLKFKPLKIQV